MEALEEKMSKIESRIKTSQAEVPTLLEASPESYREARTLLLSVLGTEIEDVRMKKRHLVDNVPGILPHLGGIVDRIRSAAGALIAPSAALGLQTSEQVHPLHPPQQQEQDGRGC